MGVKSRASYADRMGKLIYGPGVEVEVPDLSLLHLDVLLADNPGLAFQLHLTLGGAEDGDLISLSVGVGAPLAIKFANRMPEEPLDLELMHGLNRAARERGLVSLPLLPIAKSPDPYTA